MQSNRDRGNTQIVNNSIVCPVPYVWAITEASQENSKTPVHMLLLEAISKAHQIPPMDICSAHEKVPCLRYNVGRTHRKVLLLVRYSYFLYPAGWPEVESGDSAAGARAASGYGGYQDSGRRRHDSIRVCFEHGYRRTSDDDACLRPQHSRTSSNKRTLSFPFLSAVTQFLSRIQVDRGTIESGFGSLNRDTSDGLGSWMLRSL